MTEREQKRLAKLQEQMSQTKAKASAIIARDKARERKARTRRLIQNGALAEKYLGCEEIEPLDFEIKLKEIASKLEVSGG